MAKEEEIGSLIVRVGLDGAKFEDGIKNINARMALARSELKASASQFNNFGKTVDTLRIKQQNLAKQYQLQGKRVQQLKNQYDQLVKAHGAESDAALRAGARLNYAIATYNRMGKQLDSLTKEVQYQSSVWHRAEQSISSFANRAQGAGGTLQNIGQRLTSGVSAPLATLGGIALKSAIDFQRSQGQMQASLGVTEAEAKRMNQSAMNIWKQGFGESMKDASQGIIEVRKNLQNISGKQLEDVTRKAFVLKETFGYEIPESTRAAKALIDNFGVDAGKAFDYITVAAQKGGDYSQELLDTISEYSVQFKSAGLSIDQMFNILIQGAQNGGWSMDKVADAVKEFHIRAQDGSKTTAEGFAMIGLDANKMGEAIAKGGEEGQRAFMATVAALAAMKDPLKQNQAGVALFGTQWEDVREKVITAMDPTKNVLGEVAGATDRAGRALQDNLGARATRDLRALGAALIPLGNVLLNTIEPAFEGASRYIKEFAEWMENLSPGARKLVVAIGLAAAAFGPLAIGLGAVIRGVGTVSGALSKGIGWFGRYRVEASLTSKSIAALGTTATIAETKMATANATMGKASKGMSALKGGAIVAGGALAAFGGTWGTLAGIAVTFLPQIINVGKNILTFGKNATVSAGGIGGLALKVLGTIKNFASLSRIIGIARLGLGALGGPIGLTIAGVTLLTQGGIKLYQHLRQQSIPALTSFGNKVSESTTKAVLGYKKLNDQATAQLNQLYWSGTAISKQTANQLVNIFSQMGSQISQNLKTNFNKDYQTISAFLQNSKNLSKKEQQQILGDMQNKYTQQQNTVAKYENQIKDIMATASRQRRALKASERNQINQIQQKMMQTAVQTMSKSEVEQKAILARLKAESGRITAQQAAQTVQNSLKAKNGAIKAANDKYKRTVATIIRERDETHSISKSQADKLIREAERQRSQSVKKANDMHQRVVSAAKQQAKGQVKEIDWSTGTVLTRWDKMIRGVAKGVNKMIDGLNWVLSHIGLKKYKIDYWRPKGYAKGTPSSGHPGGPAIVGEKGPELAHIPGVGITMVGTQGPELIANLPKGTSILPNKHTERLLKSYGFPGYEDGVGDFFKWVIKGPKALMGNVWKKFDPRIPDLGGAFSLIGKGIISFLKDKSFSFIKDKLKDFFDFSSAKGNVKQWIATAMAITGTPAKWLNALYTLAMHESGGNPHAINLWDSNAKAGHPSKGLMQTIDSTFNRYKLPGLDDIWNPVHNAVAAIRYMLDRYGSIGNVPGIRNLARGRGYVGYAEGTPSSGHPGGPAIVGEEGEELGYIPGKGFVLLGLKGPMLLNLPKGTSILPHKFTEPLLRSYGFPAYADGVGDFPVIPAVDALSRKTESQTVDKLTTVLDKLTRILSGSGGKTDSTYVIEVRSIIDGREVAKATAKYTDEELRRNKLNRNRALGKVTLNG